MVSITRTLTVTAVKFPASPSQNPSILFGIYWLWNAITLYFRFNPVFAAKDPRRAQLGYAAASAGLGIAWIIISFFALSNEAPPMLLISLPFVVWMGWLRVKQK